MSTETASYLTESMLRALERLSDSVGDPVAVEPKALADALLRRGFIVDAHPKAHETWGKEYFITPRGRIALVIGRRHNGH